MAHPAADDGVARIDMQRKEKQMKYLLGLVLAFLLLVPLAKADDVYTMTFGSGPFSLPGSNTQLQFRLPKLIGDSQISDRIVCRFLRRPVFDPINQHTVPTAETFPVQDGHGMEPSHLISLSASADSLWRRFTTKWTHHTAVLLRTAVSRLRTVSGSTGTSTILNSAKRRLPVLEHTLQSCMGLMCGMGPTRWVRVAILSEGKVPLAF
jgi:hypothetical protein